MSGDGQTVDDGRGDGLTLFVGSIEEVSTDGEAGPGSGGADVVEYRVVAVKGSSSPVFRDLAEEPVLDRIPFRGSRRVVGNGDGEAMSRGEALMQGKLPCAVGRSVSSATVSEDSELGDPGVTESSLFSPPQLDGVDSEVSGIS